MFQQYQIMLLILYFLFFSIEIKANPNEDKLARWAESEVIIYTLKQQNFLADLVFSEQKWNVQGKCFGNLISPKFVLTISSYILEERERSVNDKIVKNLIEEARVFRVIVFKKQGIIAFTKFSNWTISNASEIK